AVVRPPARSDVEAEHPELVAAVLGDLVRAPRRHPDPVDRDVPLELLQGAGRLVLDDVGQRAGGAGQRHVEGDGGVVGPDPVQQAQVDHVDAELRVDDVLERLADLLDQRLVHGRAALLGGGRRGLVLRHETPSGPAPAWRGSSSEACFSRDCTVASFHAIQASRAHLIRAGYLDTPAKATASSSTSSSGSPCPLECMSSLNESSSFMPSSTVRPISRSVMTEALAWLIEQPMLS